MVSKNISSSPASARYKIILFFEFLENLWLGIFVNHLKQNEKRLFHNSHTAQGFLF